MKNFRPLTTDIYKFLTGLASEEESSRLIEWLRESNDNRRQYFAIKRIWLESVEAPDKEKAIEDSWGRLRLRTLFQPETVKNRPFSLPVNFGRISVAATILILVGLSLFLGIKYNNLSSYQYTTHEIFVPIGSRSNITLPDGTNVWINAGSKLVYSSDFGRRERSVSLTGEAFFDVSHDQSSVFTVKTRDIDIRVLGTRFNVKSYPEETVTETTLVEGEIEVIVTDDQIRAKPITLSPNQRVVYSRNMREFVVADDSKLTENKESTDYKAEPSQKARVVISNVPHPEEYSSWKDGRLTVRAESLSTLAPKLERFYNVQISFKDDTLKSIKYSGTLEEVTIEEVMKAISRASDIRFSIDKNQIILSY